MASGAYDVAIALPRNDELGHLATTFDQLRERLRTTTISRDYLDKVLGSMSEALLLASLDGLITRVNPAATRLLEFGESELVGRPLAGLVIPVRRAEFSLADTGARAGDHAP
jgi:PAS domain-containing protein